MESTKRSEQEEERQYLIVDRIEVNTEEEDEPDGGWGWVVVLACFLTTFTLDGKPILYILSAVLNMYSEWDHNLILISKDSE